MPASVYLQLLAATFLWGTAFPIAKKALETAPPLTLAGMRFTMAGLILLAISSFSRAFEKNESPAVAGSANWPRVLLIGLLSTAIFYGMFFMGVARTSASSAAVVDGAGPVISAVMAHFVLHADRLTRQKLLAIALAVVGVVVIGVFRPHSGESAVSVSGILLILFGLVIGNAGTMMVITYRGSLNLIRLTGFQMLFGGGVLLVVATVVERWNWRGAFTPQFLAMWVWLSSLSAVAFRLWYGLLRRYKVTSISIYVALNAVWGTALSVLILREQLHWPLVAGLMLIGSGVVLMNLQRESHERELPPETAP